MAVGVNLHSRIVAWLKVILPLAALVSLSTMFLVSHKINPEDAIPNAGVDVADRVGDPRMILPEYAGVTDSGTAVVVTAKEAHPAEEGGSDAGRGKTVWARYDHLRGGSTYLESPNALIALDKSRVFFSGGVTVTDSSGYQVDSPEMSAALKTTDIVSGGGEVRAKGPLGNIRADQMHLSLEGGDYVLVFNGSVHLIYDPAE